jgi:3-oxoadipate enol-lactonase
MPYLTLADGGRIYFEIHGDRAAAPLLLMEGLGGDLPGWRRNIPHLAAAHRVIAYDHRGNGRSDDPPHGCTMSTFVDDAVRLLDHLQTPRSHVYGQSFGGMVAQGFALAAADHLRALVLACTHCGGPHAVRETVRVPKDRPHLALYGERFAAEHPEHIAEDLRIGGAQVQHPVGQRRQWEAMQGFDTYDRLPELRVPTLVLHGTDDRTVAPANARILAERIHGAELRWLEGAGHLYHSEQADTADAAVLDFLSRHAGV